MKYDNKCQFDRKKSPSHRAYSRGIVGKGKFVPILVIADEGGRQYKKEEKGTEGRASSSFGRGGRRTEKKKRKQ